MGTSFSSRVSVQCVLLLGLLVGCGKSGSSAPPGAGTAGGTGMLNGYAGAGNFPDAGGVSVGPVDGSVDTKLPALPGLNHVVAKLNDDSAEVTFDPVDGALDYRIYPLPKDSDITVGASGDVVVKDAIYRCSGDRETAPVMMDDGPGIGGDAVRTQVVATVGNYARTLDDAVLGYVHSDPGPGLVPVYVLGESDINADVTCFFARWDASRSKKYTSSEAERDQLLAAGARDDGIAFYVPAAAGDGTTQIYFEEDQAGSAYQQRYYFSDGPEADIRNGKVPAFLVSKTADAGAQPLLRVFYLNTCGWCHDELAVGRERFNRVYQQHDKLPWWTLLWSGIQGPTTLVVEALDAGCPYQGFFSPVAIPSVTATYGMNSIVHEPYVTLDQMHSASATSEVFMNGQHGPAWISDGSKLINGQQPTPPAAPPLPKAIARSFVKVEPNPHPKMDFFADFNGAPEVFQKAPCADGSSSCPFDVHQLSATYDQTFVYPEIMDVNTQAPLISYGQVMGEWWIGYADQSSDTNGKYRLTPFQKANMDAASFLHVTMEVDMVSTARRYPQILISDQEAPVQNTLDKGHTLIVQPRGSTSTDIDWPVELQIEICNLRTWDVNNQCPQYDLRHLPKPGAPAGTLQLAPNLELGEHASVDHRAKFDVYASTGRVYVFLEDQPYGCADMPADSLPKGPVTVTWGDVLYHSGVDHVFAFHAAHMQIDTRRHFDNLGFSSGLPAPGWDESRLPCVAPISLTQ